MTIKEIGTKYEAFQYSLTVNRQGYDMLMKDVNALLEEYKRSLREKCLAMKRSLSGLSGDDLVNDSARNAALDDVLNLIGI